MTRRRAVASWSGTVLDGSGTVALRDSGMGPWPLSLLARATDDTPAGTGPEELLAGAYAACLAMQLAAMLGEDGPQLGVQVTVNQGGPDVDFAITGVEIGVVADPGDDPDGLSALIRDAASQCPIGRALGTVAKTVDVRWR